MAGGGGDAQALRHEEAEARRVQVGAGANDTALGQTGQLPRDVREDVHGVRDDQQDGVGAVLHQLGNDALQDVGVALDEVQTALAGALTGTSCDDAQAGSSGDGKV